MKPKKIVRDVRISLEPEELARLDKACAKTVQSRVQFTVKALRDRMDSVADSEVSS